MASKGKIQRSFYLSEVQARWLKIESAKRSTSQSQLLSDLIDTARLPSVKTFTTPEDVKRQGKNVHEVLSKIAKQ